MNAAQLVVYLNAIHVGDMDGILVKPEEARQACEQIEQQALADKLADAVAALEQADLKTYRRQVQTVISQLGHLR